MVPDMVHTPTWDKLFYFVYHNLRSANAAPFYYGSCPYTDGAGYSTPYFHDGYTYANAAFLYGAYGNAAPFYYGDCQYTYDAKYLGKRHLSLWHGTGSEPYVEDKNKNKTKKECATSRKSTTSFFTRNLRLRISYCLYFLNFCNVTYSIEQGTKKVHQKAQKKISKHLKS